MGGCLAGAAWSPPGLVTVASLMDQSGDIARMTSAAWEALAVEVARLEPLVARRAFDADLRWRVRALRRAVATRNPALLPLALGRTGRAPPASAAAWAREGAILREHELAEVAVWHMADAAHALAEGATVDVLRGARKVLGDWEGW